MSLENPMPGGQTPPVGAQQPAYPLYPPYYGYPAYAPRPYYGYAAIAHAGPPMLAPVPARAPDKPARQRLTNLVVVVVLVGLTAGSLALALVAPLLVTRDPGPPSASGFTAAYNAPLQDDTSNWDITHGCALAYGGLHAGNGSTPTLCLFTPSQSTDYTASGFYLTTQLAPPGAVSSIEGACIDVSSSAGSVVSFAIDQTGQFAINTDATFQCTTTSPPGQLQQATAAWHGDGSVPNTVSLAYDASSNLMTAYLNGQQIAQRGVQLNGAHEISLGAPAGDEAIFISFGLWQHN